jgi:hypothetical protein
MKNSEEAIERALGGLRDVEAPEGMERRILDGLEGRSVARRRSGWRRFAPVWLAMPSRPVATTSLTCGIAFAGLVAIALAIPAIRRFGHTPAQSLSQPKVNSVSVEPLIPAVPATVAKDAQLRSPEPGARSAVRFVARKNASTAKAARDSDSVALNEMHDASFPAPPMPLTEQERLLLRIVHKGDPVEIAMLDPVARAARDAEEKAAVTNFFEPPTTKGNE